MAIATGTKLGPYEIAVPVGAGGMGEVYRARDTRLGRDVAVKVLPSSFSTDSDRLHRFEQEACAASALNHPNILIVHDIGTHDGSPYIVSELLEGETLRQRMSSLGAHASSVPVAQRKAIDYALQIAHGLAAAHEKGIVHRDLKPDNIFITKDGRVKILDFGIAKLTQPDGNQSQTEIPTRRVDTDPGVVMGTVGYMSPEQVRGQPVNHRSDIFSFGAILYEMLSGRRAFRGESAADTMSAILKEDPPDLSETNHTVSPALERLVNHCLEKNPEERFHSASDLAFALEALSGSAPVSAQTTSAISASPVSARLVKHLPWIVAGTLALALLITIALLISSFKQTPTRTNVIRAAILPPEGANYLPRNQFAVSPDGLRIVFVGRSGDGKLLLWVRSLGAVTAQPLAGTDGAEYPFWSPDSRFVGFFAQTKLKKIDASGGPPQTICDAPNGRGASWNRDGLIVFAPDNFSPLYRVSASGGVTTVVSKLDDSKLQATHRWPWFLPDGRHFLYRAATTSAASPKENNGIYLGSLDSLEQRLIVRTDTSPVFESGYLLFIRDGTLMAQPFDEKAFQTTGDAQPVAEHVQFDFGVARAEFTTSENGVLIFQGTLATTDRQLLWFDLSGKQTGSIGEPSLVSQPHLSPDGQRVATSIFDLQAGSPDVWIYELSRNVPARFTFDPDFDAYSVWSPDGSRIVWASNRKGHYDIYQKASTGAGSDEILLESEENKSPTSWSPDGRFIAYTSTNIKGNTKYDIWILPLSGDRKPFPFLRTQFNEVDAQFSPDGRWLAYVSDESGANQVYVAPFPGPGGKWQVSRSGGTEPRWRGDGREIFFVSPDNKLMATEVNPKESTLEIGNAQPLFDLRLANSPGYRYDVTRDGKRFLVDTQKLGSSVPLELFVNWTADLKK